MKLFDRFHSRWRWFVATPLLVAVLLMAALAAVSVDVLSSARACAAAEGFASEGRRDALYLLERYADSRDPADHRRYQEALAAPQAARLARTELERPDADLAVVRRGFLDGGSHPDDVDGMVRLYRWFRGTDLMAQTLALWARSDQSLAELESLGQALQAHIQSGAGDAGLRRLRERLPELNARVTVIERQQAAKLGEASRLARRFSFVCIGLFAAVLLLTGLSVMFHLMRQQKRAQRALHESIERWTLAAEAAGIGLFDWDLARQQIAFDARAAALYGLEGQALEFQPGGLARACVHPDDLDRVSSTLQNAVEKSAPLAMRYRLLVPGRAVAHVELNARVRRRGQDLHMVGILWDVSDDVQAEQLRFDKQAAERASRAKSLFLSRASHELRTPLNAVLGFTQLLQLDTAEPLTPRQAERVQYVIDNGRHLLELINNMLDVTSLQDEGALNLATLRVDVVPLLNASRRLVEPLALQRGVPITCEWPASALWVRADPRRLQQVFGNLLSNAVKYNRPDGVVRVACAREGLHAVISVQDTGPGLTAQQVEQLFQPFNRLGAEFSKESGSGLGLMISQQLVRLMGGQITVRSDVGVGTTFLLRLPLAGEADPGDPLAPKAPARPGAAGAVPDPS